MFAHFSGDVGQNLVLVVELHFEHGALHDRPDGSFDFDDFACHSFWTLKLAEARHGVHGYFLGRCSGPFLILLLLFILILTCCSGEEQE